MPGMTSIPILSATPSAALAATAAPHNPPAAPSPASQTAPVNPPARAAASDTANAANSAGTANDAAATGDNNASGSFANVLQRQMAQATPGAQPPAQASLAPFDPSLLQGGSLQPNAILIANLMAAQTSNTDLAATDPRLLAPTTVAAASDAHGRNPNAAAPLALAADAAGKEDGGIAGLEVAAAASALTVGNASNPALKTAIAPADQPVATTATASKDDEEAPQATADNPLAALLANLPGMMHNLPAKADSRASQGEDNASTADRQGPLTTAFSSSLIGGEGKNGDLSKPSDATQLPTDKAADFAAPLTGSAEAPQQHANLHDNGSNEASFDNMLAAAQLANHVRSNDSPSSSHTALAVQTPVGAHGWDSEVGDKVVWMVGRQEQRAELVLNPPQLGRVEVSLTVSNDQTNATFVSANPAVRDALETALPRLREMLADAGVTLGQAQVGADSGNNAANQSARNQENRDNSSRFSDRDDAALNVNILRQTGTSQWLKQGRGLVDTFA